MKRTSWTLIVCLLCLQCILLCTWTLPIKAQDADSAARDAQAIADGILSYHLQKAGADSVQEWIDTALTAEAGVSAEWYILSLAQSGEYDFTAYGQALLCYLDANTVPSATTKQKYALVLSSIGSTDAYISKTTDSTVGALGIVSYVYGLHLVNNGYQAPLSADGIINEILSMQKDDGGWATGGTVSDADVTAMALQALAPYAGARQDVADAVERALSLLSARQTDKGGFKSYGVENPESAAQVIIALCSLGIDPCTDARFVKNGHTVWDSIASFALPDGGYAHTADGSYSSSATAQVFCAATAYLRYANGRASLYALDRARPDEVLSAPETETAPPTESTAPNTLQPAPTQNGLSYKPFACAAVLLSGAICCAVLIACKKTNYKNFIALGLAAAVLIAAILLIDIRTPEQYYGGEEITKQNPIGTVTLTVRCDAVPDLDKIDHLPDDGVILATETYEIEAGETVYDILVQAARKHTLHLDAAGAGEAMYVRGIGHLYEMEHGDLSGWSYRVNGESPSQGCASYPLSDGDEIVWEYTLTVGK